MRALILSAPVGESHLAMARSLAADVEARIPEASVIVRNEWSVLGPLLGRILGRGYTYHLGEVQWSYDLGYRLFTGVRAARAAGELALYGAGGALALAREVAGARPDVVVSTHPVLNAVLGRLRAAGRIACPVALVVGPLGGLGFWVQPGADIHLLNYAEALAAVEREAGPARAVAVRPLVRAEFFSAPERAQARAALGLAAEARYVLISGGGWGAGDLAGAVDAALRVSGAHVIAVAGRNAALRDAVSERYGGDGRVTVLGFTERMPELLAAADVFVTATVGLSCLEAQLCGCPIVCYGFTIGHIRDNVRALERAGLARPAATPEQLSGRLAEVLGTGAGGGPAEVLGTGAGGGPAEGLGTGAGGGPAAGRAAIPERAHLPHAADVLLEVAEQGGSIRAAAPDAAAAGRS